MGEGEGGEFIEDDVGGVGGWLGGLYEVAGGEVVGEAGGGESEYCWCFGIGFCGYHWVDIFMCILATGPV